MITYNPAFDLYHSIFRMAHIVQKLDEGERFEVDKVRIWDFYLLFPDKVYSIFMRQDEKKLREYRKTYIVRENNPYSYWGDNRRLFEWIKPFQMSALNCLVSCGILDRDEYLNNRIVIANRQTLDAFVKKAGSITAKESNVLAFLSILSRQMPLGGTNGLKARTHLLESRYDAE